MSDEIKEKLDNLRIYAGRQENGFISDIEDYITNLQQENERLKNDIEDISCSHFSLFKQYEDYKSRVEKAVEYINNFSVDKSFSFPLMKRWEENQVKGSIDYEFKTTLYKNLLNILQGGKDE